LDKQLRLHHPTFWALGTLAALLTSFYMFR